MKFQVNFINIFLPDLILKSEFLFNFVVAFCQKSNKHVILVVVIDTSQYIILFELREVSASNQMKVLDL